MTFQKIHNLGSFETESAVWLRYPEGGKEGDFLTISGIVYYWDKYSDRWEPGEESTGVTEDTEVTESIITEQAGKDDVDPQNIGIHLLGAFSNVGDVWERYPEGGKEGDYVQIIKDDGGAVENYYWNKYTALWDNKYSEGDKTSGIQGSDVSAPFLQINNLGSFATINAVWDVHPEGGKEGDYLSAGGKIWWWNKYTGKWTDTAVSTEADLPISETDAKDVQTVLQELVYLGEFKSESEVWEKYPAGGKEGEYLTIGGVKYYWNPYNNAWQSGNTAGKANGKKLYELDGDTVVGGYATVKGDAHINGGAYIKGSIATDGDVTAAGDVTAKGGVSASGNITTSGDITAQNGSFTGNVRVDGEATLPNASLPQYDKKIEDTTAELKKLITAAQTSGDAQLAVKLEEVMAAVSKQYLSKTSDDTAAGVITLLKGLLLGDGTHGVDENGAARLASLLISGLYGIDKDGKGTLSALENNGDLNNAGSITNKGDFNNAGNIVNSGSLTSKGEVRSEGGLTNTGELTNNGNITNSGNIANKGGITTRNLTVTGAAHFFKLVIDEIKSAGGSLILTPANGFVTEKVIHTDGDTHYKLLWKASDGQKSITNMWMEGDQAICMTDNLAAGTTYNASNRFWWVLVTDAGATTVDGTRYNYITVNFDRSAGAGAVSAGTPADIVPQVGDNVAMLGSRATDKDSGEVLTDRQNAVYIAAHGSLDTGLTAPFMAFYRGITTFELEKYRKTHFAPNSSAVIANNFIMTGDDYEAPVTTYLGEWTKGMTVPYGGVVSYNGRTWTCINPKGADGIEPTKQATAYWASNKGDSYDIAFSLNGIRVDTLNYDDVKAMESASLQVDFLNDGDPYTAAKATITCYDASGAVLGSPIELTDTTSDIIDGGNLYLSKDCKQITAVAYDAAGRQVVSKSLGVIRNGEKGDEPIIVAVYCSDGEHVIRNGSGQVTLSAVVTKNGEDITTNYADSLFSWTRDSGKGNEASDKTWNNQHKAIGPTVTVLASEVTRQAFFDCILTL